MTNIICTIVIAINFGGVGFITKADVEGKILRASQTKYLVDFSEGVKKYPLAGRPEDYSSVVVDKKDCL